jgi:hypothetical protein
MALDFTTGVLDNRVTVTRALNTATRVNSSGYIEAVNANLPRFDYDPVTLLPRGLLIEETRANFVLQSNTLNAGSGISVTSAAATSPDGTTNAYRVAKTDATTPRYTSNNTSMTVTSNTTYTVSRFVKYDGFNTTVSLEYNNTINWDLSWNAQFTVASTGVTVLSAAGCTAAAQNFGDSWYRITATFTTGALVTSPTNPTFLMRLTGASGVTVLGYGAQLELGAFATSYIPTTTTNLTRNADAVSMTGTNFSDWYNESEGAFKVCAGLLFDITSSTIMAVKNAAVTNTIGFDLDASNGLRWRITDAGANQAFCYLASPATANTRYIMCGRYKVNSFAASANGGAPVTDSAGTVPATNTYLAIGSNSALGATPINGYVECIYYWPQALTNAEVQAFSK